MLLQDIIRDCGSTGVEGRTDRSISSICCDSRKAVPSSLFIAVKGKASDGHRYIASAIRGGAVAIMYEDRDALCSELAKFSPENDLQAKSGTVPAVDSLTLIRVGSSRHAMAIAARNFYGDPSSELTLVGVTGTNGKTTTATLLYNMYMDRGIECGLLSTIANYVGKEMTETLNTTSDPITINALLRKMVDGGCRYCFMEVSSIGLEQERVSGLHFKVAIFTNLTHDHLDYHGTFAEYLRCKKLLFDNLGKDSFALVNMDDRNGQVMVQNCAATVVTYSLRSLADHTCRVIEESVDGMQLRIDGKEVWTTLIGQHNAYNLLSIYCTAILLGMEQQQALVGLSKLQSARGRLETIHGKKELSVVIDYAHTPDALENVLKALRGTAPRSPLVCLFGCGGDRDRSKRPEMAAVSEKYSDIIVVTSDNSRSEKTEDIMEDIRGGFTPRGEARTLFISDRKQAIRTAILTAPRGATILLAGKGHETYQIIDGEKKHFDEREIVQEVFDSMDPQQ